MVVFQIIIRYSPTLLHFFHTTHVCKDDTRLQELISVQNGRPPASWREDLGILQLRTKCNKINQMVGAFILSNIVEFEKDVNKSVTKEKECRVYYKSFTHQSNALPLSYRILTRATGTLNNYKFPRQKCYHIYLFFSSLILLNVELPNIIILSRQLLKNFPQ